MPLLEGLLERRHSRPPIPQKAALGRGVDAAIYGIPLASALSDPASAATQALAAYKWSPYIRSAERAIKGVLSTLDWWLEDPEGERVTEESRDQYRAVWDLLQNPYTPGPDEPEAASPRTWSGLTELTWRHMGCAGIGYWYLDSINALGIPTQVLYISPARMTPVSPNGRLVGYVMDYRKPTQTEFHLDEIVPFYLEQPDDGFVPTGLVHTAMAKAELARRADAHAAYTLQSGGRRPGIYHPPAGASIPPDVYEQLKRDLRSIVEVPDSQKRSMILQGPVEFDATDSTISDMKLLDIMAMARDDIFGIWGTPPSQVGYQRPGGIGETSTDKDAESMWKNAAQPRLMPFWETLQTRFLDRWDALGIDLTLKFDIPTFDDDAPKFEMAQSALNLPLRNVERRALIGLEPFGVPELDDAIILPTTIGTVAVAPPFDAGDMPGKARLPASVVHLQDALSDFLRAQSTRIGRAIEKNAAHLKRKPKDVGAWWNEHEEDEALLAVLRPFITDMALATGEKSKTKMQEARGTSGKAELDMTNILLNSTLRRLALRVRGINQTTRDRIRDLTIEAVDAGMSPAQLGRALRGVVPPLPDDAAAWKPVLEGAERSFASELRAETIARTEMRVAQNAAQIDSFTALGSTMVEMIDGDDDPACAARNGRTVPMEEAEAHMLNEHPNGTLTFVPTLETAPVGKAAPLPEPDVVTMSTEVWGALKAGLTRPEPAPPAEPMSITVAPSAVTMDPEPFAKAVAESSQMIADAMSEMDRANAERMATLAEQLGAQLASLGKMQAASLDRTVEVYKATLPEPAQITVNVPEQPPATVSITTPDTIRIESMPMRVTRRSVGKRDAQGNIQEVTDVETDA